MYVLTYKNILYIRYVLHQGVVVYTFSFVTLHATNSPKGENHKINEARNVPPQNPG